VHQTKYLLQLRQVVAEKEEHEATSSGHQVLYRARICKRLRSPGIDSANLCSLAGRYVKLGRRTGPPGWESIPGLLKSFTNAGSVYMK
jgi:hypothetical protein